ncbi:hypothetical protein [Candidatus Binatus soli]|uniref:hypothetical protein n=1 Tax=Candidatus Binatus soli TaxID=1953413 RepID=UPI003D0E48FC
MDFNPKRAPIYEDYVRSSGRWVLAQYAVSDAIVQNGSVRDAPLVAFSAHNY